MNKLTKIILAAILVVGAIVGILAGVGLFTSSKSSSTTLPNSNNDSNSSSTPVPNSGNSTVREGHPDRPSTCKPVEPGKRLAVFWLTEVDGCETVSMQTIFLVPDGVTHVYFAFAEIKAGLVNQSFQTGDTNVTKCVTALRKRCIFSLGSVGGALANKYMKTIKDPDAFAKSGMALIEKFKFDGIDMDDESVGSDFDGTRVLAYMKALYTAMKSNGKNYLLTYDAFMYEGNLDTCKDAWYIRCWPVGLDKYIDWVNVMAYNINDKNDTANAMYLAATKPGDIFSRFADLVTAPKVTIGICSTGGCAYGPGPSTTVVASWTKWAENYGGMMVWVASRDYTHDYEYTNLIIKSQ
ncbi:carbohydrate-binding protein [Thraustotheca clavata]|uniref:Carbohydrate-binding protein n=1 Tax=Thraustotheca clavata TaxID=74557 RepID=A0A1V9ZHL0_9STRA|nr:carbohydrate-binding protein [Thraustotheca clavata]